MYFRRLSALVFFILVFICVELFSLDSSLVEEITAALPTPSPTVSALDMALVPVVEVVDGDTLKVEIEGATKTVRIVGINTPETRDPRKPVECYGQEASDALRALVENQLVRLEADSTQADADRYGRLLRFVFLSDDTDVGLWMIAQGYAQESLYSSKPHKYREIYLQAQEQAQLAESGLWSAQTCAGELRPAVFPTS